MTIWLKKDFNQTSGEMMVSFDPPEENEVDDWLLFTTREQHYSEIAKVLDKQVRQYRLENDFRAAKVASDLADQLRNKRLEDVNLN